ncbi:MAG: Gfo/Idh/MocA family oxidoreductase [Candidatus Omnitrophica bacterium]|nr:Gfo/Idh/MocA family oxidoreductase [Candidatus Omnitrophota bacterium]
MNPIKVAVVGVGHLGSIHARIYSELESAQLVAACDTQPDRAQAAASQYGCRPETDFRKLLAQVEAVSIAVPTQGHFPIAKEFLSRGIHTLVEKPITSTVREADQLLRLARRHRALLQVGHVERFNSALRRVADSLKDPRFIEVHRLAPFQPRGTEVGVVLDLMIHDIDILLGLVRNRIRRIEAVGVKVLTPFEDIANARITFANGAVANLTSSRISKEAMRKFRIFQTDSYVSMDFLSSAVDIFRHQEGRISHEALTIPKEEPLKAELASFLDAIRGRRPPAVTGREAVVRPPLAEATGREAREALAVALKITRLIHGVRHYGV